MSVRDAVLWAILIAFSYAAFDEAHQLFISGRSAQVSDVVLDTVAACVGTTLYVAAAQYTKRHKEKTHEKQ